MPADMPTALNVCTFYRFVALTGLEDLQRRLQDRGETLNLKGTILLAAEGINATLTGLQQALETFLGEIRDLPEFAGLPAKFSMSEPGNPVFHRLKVRIKAEIVAMGVPHVDPERRTGEHVSAERWNALLDDPSVLVIDTRNAYETAIGSFPRAILPNTRSFREFPDYVHTHLDPSRHRAVAMFCTGGIRCEKASAWMLEQGFERVYQLDGGILKYFETVEPEANRWQGECFVFDQRVALNAALLEGEHVLCFACRRPLSAADQEHADYEVGVSCPQCIGEHTEASRDGFRERQRQVTLAERRGTKHIGAVQSPRQ